ncbi:MAG: porin [Gammaproteobacteria bacterium]
MRKIIALLALPLAASAVHAQEASSGPSFKFSGYGTAAVTWTDEDKAEYGRPNQVRGVKQHPGVGVDSNLGLQADVQVADWLSFTAQALVRKDAEDRFNGELGWAFAKLRLSDGVSVRAGRVGLPIFMISEYRNVGYANTLLRPPAEVYSQVPFNSIDGMDVSWQHNVGETTVSTQFAYGQVKSPIASGPHVDGKEIMALQVVAEHGPLTLRAGHAIMKLNISDSVSLNALMASLRAAGAGYRQPGMIRMADELQAKDKRGTFDSLGAALDWNNLVGQSEVTRRRTDTYINDTTSWYVMLGYRFGKFLPYASHASLKIDGYVQSAIPAACPAGYPAACTPTMRQLAAGAARVPYSGPGQGAQTTHTIGVRWDLYQSLALKAQIDRVKPTAGTGLLLGVQPGFVGPVTVGAVALDFVF